MKIELITFTQNAELTIANIAKTCYDSQEKTIEQS